MERRRVICPATRQAEEVDVERTSVGVVVTGCSRFQPREAVDCGRICARDIDRVDRIDVDDLVERVLIVIPGTDAATRSVAEFLARCLERDGLVCELAKADARSAPPVADYDAVVIGTRVRFGRHPRSVIEYVVWNRAALADKPASCIAVGRTTRVHGSIERLVRETGWSPTARLELVVADKGFDQARVREFARTIADGVPPLELAPAMG